MVFILKNDAYRTQAIYLGLEFEFGLQKIRDLAMVCPESMTMTIH